MDVVRSVILLAALAIGTFVGLASQVYAGSLPAQRYPEAMPVAYSAQIDAISKQNLENFEWGASKNCHELRGQEACCSSCTQAVADFPAAYKAFSLADGAVDLFWRTTRLKCRAVLPEGKPPRL